MLDVIREADARSGRRGGTGRELLRSDLRSPACSFRRCRPPTRPSRCKALPLYCQASETVPHAGPTQDAQRPGARTPRADPAPAAPYRPGREARTASAARTAALSNWSLTGHRDRPGAGRRPAGRPLRGRGPQEVGDQRRLHLVRDHRDRDGAPVPAGRHRAGDRRRAAGLLDPLRGADRGREPGRPGVHAPWLAMWSPTSSSRSSGVIGLVRVSRESGSTRGGDFQEVLDGIRHLFRGSGGGCGPAGRRA